MSPSTWLAIDQNEPEVRIPDSERSALINSIFTRNGLFSLSFLGDGCCVGNLLNQMKKVKSSLFHKIIGFKKKITIEIV